MQKKEMHGINNKAITTYLNIWSFYVHKADCRALHGFSCTTRNRRLEQHSTQEWMFSEFDLYIISLTIMFLLSR